MNDCRHIEEEEEEGKIIPRFRAVLSEESAETIGKDFQNRELRIRLLDGGGFGWGDSPAGKIGSVIIKGG